MFTKGYDLGQLGFTRSEIASTGTPGTQKVSIHTIVHRSHMTPPTLHEPKEKFVSGEFVRHQKIHAALQPVPDGVKKFKGFQSYNDVRPELTPKDEQIRFIEPTIKEIDTQVTQITHGSNSYNSMRPTFVMLE